MSEVEGHPDEEMDLDPVETDDHEEPEALDPDEDRESTVQGEDEDD